jgi:hypothetical protein
MVLTNLALADTTVLKSAVVILTYKLTNDQNGEESR